MLEPHRLRNLGCSRDTSVFSLDVPGGTGRSPLDAQQSAGSCFDSIDPLSEIDFG